MHYDWDNIHTYPFSFLQFSNSSKVCLDTLGLHVFKAATKSFNYIPLTSVISFILSNSSVGISLTGIIAVSFINAIKSAEV